MSWPSTHIYVSSGNCPKSVKREISHCRKHIRGLRFIVYFQRLYRVGHTPIPSWCQSWEGSGKIQGQRTVVCFGCEGDRTAKVPSELESGSQKASIQSERSEDTLVINLECNSCGKIAIKSISPGDKIKLRCEFGGRYQHVE